MYIQMALATTNSIHGCGGRGQELCWGIDHSLNTAVNQSGQAHTNPRAELLAMVIAIEQARWPIHIYSDNLGYVIATLKLFERREHKFAQR